MKSIINLISERLKRVFLEDTGKIILIALFDFLFYGVDRYFLGRYSQLSLYLKLGKFFISYLDNFFFVIGIFFLLTFLKEGIRRFITWCLVGVTFFLCLIDIFLFKEFKAVINGTSIGILFESNRNEGIEFLKTYVTNETLIIFVIGIIGIYFISKIKVKVNSKLFLTLIFICSSIQIFSIDKIMEKSLLKRAGSSFIKSIDNIRKYKEIANNLNFNVEILENNSKIKNVVLIIGESTTRNHMSLYGYNLDTNPMLKRLKYEGNLYVFNDVISPHSHTVPSLKKVLTFYNNDSAKEWYEYNNIIDIMKTAGYTTYWFSNQESFGQFGNIAAAIGNRSDNILFNRIRDSDEEVFEVYDEEIVDKSSKIKKENEKNFIVYHLMGTHTGYENRYPIEYNKFNKENYNKGLEDKKRKVIAFYDNAVLYNDYVVKKIIDVYKDSESIVFYLSDHGEEVYDFRDFLGHAEDNSSRYMAEIPFMIYLSDKVKNENLDLERRILSSVNKPYMSDDFLHTFLDIIGIKTIEFDESKSIINKNFNKNRERIFANMNYDNYWKNRD